MTEFKDMLKYFRHREGLSQAQLAKALGLSASTISMYEVGSRQPDFETEENIADFFNTDLNTLRGRDIEYSHSIPDGALHVTKRTIPVLGKIACGEPVYEYEVNYDDAEEYPISADFALIAEGDSMVNARINDGDLVFFSKQSTVNNGEIAAVSIDGEVTLKRFYYYKDTNTVQLVAENPNYAPMVFNGDQLQRIMIIGKAIAFRSEIK